MGIKLMSGGLRRAYRRRGGRALVAAAVAACLVIPATPAMADGPGGPIGGGGGGDTCVLGPGGATGVTVGYQGSPTSSSLGLTLPTLSPAPADVSAVIAPGPGETFSPLTLTQVSAAPMAKVLKGGTVDPAQAVMEWRFRVQQQCPDGGPVVTCDFFYHEMADGSVWEIATLPDGSLFEHAFRTECLGGWAAFREPGLPPDLGARLLAAAKANADMGALQANAVSAMGSWVVAAAGVPSVVLPPDMAAWAGLIAAALGLTGLLTGGCGGYFTAVAASEISVWTNLLTLAYAPPDARVPKAATAAVAKATSIAAFVMLIPTCVAQSVGSGATLTALYDLIMSLGAIIFWSSSALMAVYGLDFLVSYWTS